MVWAGWVLNPTIVMWRPAVGNQGRPIVLPPQNVNEARAAGPFTALSAERYFYCLRLATLIELPTGQSVKCFVMVEPRQFVTLQPTRAFAADADRRIATAGTAQELGQAFADLGNRDRRCPFFSPAEPRLSGTMWLAKKARRDDASPATCGLDTRLTLRPSFLARNIVQSDARSSPPVRTLREACRRESSFCFGTKS
jgi:hypothetical protein